MLGSAGAAISAAALPVGIVAAIVAAEVAFVVACKGAADELIELRKELAQVSGAMGVVYAQRELQEIMRERSRGDQLANAQGLLIRGEQKFKDEIFPWEMAWDELKTNFLAGFYNELGEIAGGINSLVKMLGIDIKNRSKVEDTKSFSALINKIAGRRGQEAGPCPSTGEGEVMATHFEYGGISLGS
jgi:hypothetical protein